MHSNPPVAVGSAPSSDAGSDRFRSSVPEVSGVLTGISGAVLGHVSPVAAGDTAVSEARLAGLAACPQAANEPTIRPPINAAATARYRRLRLMPQRYEQLASVTPELARSSEFLW